MYTSNHDKIMLFVEVSYLFGPNVIEIIGISNVLLKFNLQQLEFKSKTVIGFKLIMLLFMFKTMSFFKAIPKVAHALLQT